MTRIAIAAFSGWNDAGEAASGAVEYLQGLWPGKPAGLVEAELFTDFLVNRPEVRITDDYRRVIEWPDTEISLLDCPSGSQLVTVLGPEPSLRWTRFCDEIVEQLQILDVSQLVCLGALLADIPHTRPLPVRDRADVNVGEKVGAAEAEQMYEGPIGIPTILAQRALSAGISTRSIWVQVPHYVGQNPSPKASLALLRALQAHVPVSIPLSGMAEDAEAWERGVNELARTDEDVAQYVERLEQAQDAADLPEASGDAIARDFEQFLRHRRDE